MKRFRLALEVSETDENRDEFDGVTVGSITWCSMAGVPYPKKALEDEFTKVGKLFHASYQVLVKKAEEKVMSDRTRNTIMEFFKSDHLPDNIREPAALCAQLARQMDRSLPECAEKSAGLRKLLEAKDCFVRAKLSMGDESAPTYAPNGERVT